MNGGPAQSDASDDQLVAAAVRGDREAFAALVERHQHAARRLSAALIGSSDADDVAQEAFVRAYRSLASFKSGSAFRPWLLRIVANQASNHRRGAARRERRQALFGRRERAIEQGPDDVAEMSDERRRVRDALDSLVVRDREVLVIRFLLDYSEAETALLLGCAPGTVKSRTSRALAKLRTRTDLRASEAGHE